MGQGIKSSTHVYLVLIRKVDAEGDRLERDVRSPRSDMDPTNLQVLLWKSSVGSQNSVEISREFINGYLSTAAIMAS